MELQPLHTKIEKEIQVTNGAIVLENPTGFPRDKCNLYRIDQDDNIVWEAQKPKDQSLFSRLRLNDDGETISTYTTDGFACDLDLETGKIVNSTPFE